MASVSLYSLLQPTCKAHQNNLSYFLTPYHPLLHFEKLFETVLHLNEAGIPGPGLPSGP